MSIYDFTVKTADGSAAPLSKFKGQVMLIVNVASQCGFTPQYVGLEALYKKYADRGFVIIGFPCNQFGAQEKGSDLEIQDFCRLNFEISFPVMAKVDVNGENADPLFKYLKAEAPGLLRTEAIKWNFTKFLIGKDGRVLQRYASLTKPIELSKDIESLIGL